MQQQFTKEQLESEIWKDVIGYEGYYKVSSLGNIRSFKRNDIQRKNNSFRIINPYTDGVRYPKTSLTKNNISTHFNVHTLVAKAFIPNPKNKPQVNHKNGIRTDNRIENLEWVTCQENIIHKHSVLKTAALQYGIHNPASKLNENNVLKIRKLHITGNRTMKEISEIINTEDNVKITESNVRLIIRRLRWKHI